MEHALIVGRDGVASGPYSLEELQKKVRMNLLSPTDRACDQQGGVWLPVSKVLAGHTGETDTFKLEPLPPFWHWTNLEKQENRSLRGKPPLVDL